MTSKLNQILAVEKDVKSRSYSQLTEINKAVQKPALFNGFVKTFHKKEEDGEDFPPERLRVQFNTPDVLAAVQHQILEPLFTITARKDWTNRSAGADLEVDGQIIIEDVPVGYLLFLEKQLMDLRTLVNNLPVLDEADDWHKDENAGLYKTHETKVSRTKKTPKVITLAPATPEHPAQTQLYQEDVIIGYWHQVKFSGAVPKPTKDIVLGRIEKLHHAVKKAREEANMREEEYTPDVASAIFSYIFGSIVK